MIARFQRLILEVLRIPPAPQPPAGAPGSARVFRAGRNQLRVKLAGWGVAQVGATIGLLFSIAFLAKLDADLPEARARAAEKAAAAKAAEAAAGQDAPAAAAPEGEGTPAGDAGGHGDPAVAPAASTTAATATGEERGHGAPAVAPAETPTDEVGAAVSPAEEKRKRRKRGLQNAIRSFARGDSHEEWLDAIAGIPDWLVMVAKVFEGFAIIGFFGQFAFTLALVRLEFDQHWYIVTDRSLRIRQGLTTLTESTMSFANLQHVEVRQGPLQRVLGLADVRVQSAGGGGSPQEAKQGVESLKVGVFHGVENAVEIRDLILDRLRRFREAGLGDPDDAAPTAAAVPPPVPGADTTLAAARELLAEARALRGVLR